MANLFAMRADDDPLSADLDRRAQAVCYRLLCGGGSGPELTELARDAELAAEVRKRLHACGVEVQAARGFGRWMVHGLPELRDELPEHGLNEPQLAALAYLFLHLEIAPSPQHEQARMGVREFCQSFGRPKGWNLGYVRRAILGPLESNEYIRVVHPGGNRTDAYIEAGPRMALLDRRRLVRRLESALALREQLDDQASEPPHLTVVDGGA